MGLLMPKPGAGLSVMVRFAVAHALPAASELHFYAGQDMQS